MEKERPADQVTDPAQEQMAMAQQSGVAAGLGTCTWTDPKTSKLRTDLCVTEMWCKSVGGKWEFDPNC